MTRCAVMIVLLLSLLPTTAHASYLIGLTPHAPSERVIAHSSLSPCCRRAAALGGPCGCFASEHFFGRCVRKLWPVPAWLRFPRVAAAAGTAAVHLGHGRHHRHVTIVLAVNGDGTMTVRDSWAVHRVRTAGWIFVDPRGQHPRGQP
jgi:hypothetical protein